LSPGIRQRRLRFEAQELALVAIGALPGAWLRWHLSVLLDGWLWGGVGPTLLVNITGSLLLGFLVGPIPRKTPLLLALGVGFCGSFTSFSTWILDLYDLLEGSRYLEASCILLMSLILGILAASFGLRMSRFFFGGRDGLSC
jgi:CrcB protein